MNFADERATLRKRRLERLLARAQRRMLRRKAKAEAYWTLHVHKTGHHPTLWHTTYERAYSLEDSAHLLVIRLSHALSLLESPVKDV